MNEKQYASDLINKMREEGLSFAYIQNVIKELQVRMKRIITVKDK